MNDLNKEGFLITIKYFEHGFKQSENRLEKYSSTSLFLIGYKRVLGANVLHIVHLLSKEFIKLIAIGIIVSIPLRWLLMNQWLKNYAYRIELSWWMFALAGVMVIFLAFLTTSFQSIRAAMHNPADSLRTE